MAWFMRGVQSAVFHYASCAPCTGYNDSRKRRKAAKLARKARLKLELEQPDGYHHPEPTGTNPYWDEEIQMGPGPPPRRNRKNGTGNTGNTGSTRGITTAGTQSSARSNGDSSIDVDHPGDRSSDDTLEDDDNWNRKRYQREDEHLWGYDEPTTPLEQTLTGSSVGPGGFQKPRSKAESYYSARAPPVNELHPPVVSVPSSDPVENRWMLQPPPKASVMAGKERASNRSRSGSGASSRVELSLGRQVSTRQLMQKLERGETPEMPSNSPNGSYTNLSITGQRNSRCRTPQARPVSARQLSAASSRRRKQRDSAMARDPSVTRPETQSTQHSSNPSSETAVDGSSVPRSTLVPDIKVIRVRQSRPALSTVASSNSAGHVSPTATRPPARPNTSENTIEKPSQVHHRFSSASTSDSIPYFMKPRAPISSSDVSSLHCLQDLVSPHALLNSRFVSAPLLEAKIRLPPSEEDMASRARKERSTIGSWKMPGTEQYEQVRVPFDRDFGPPEKDPRFRWSVDF